MRVPVYFASALCLLLLALAPAAAINAGHVQGRIFDDSGHPIRGAVVTISGDRAVGVWDCETDESGFYRIAGLPATTELKLKVVAPERATVERSGYSVRADETVHLNFRLRPKGVYATLVITDPRVPYHKTALAGARETLPAGVRVFEATERTPDVVRRLNRALGARPDGVLAIGSLAAHLARETIFDIPVVYTMVLDPEKEDLKADNMCGVQSNGAFSEQLDVLERMAPKAKRIGTLFDPSRLDGVVRQLRTEAEDAGFSLEVRAVHERGDVKERLRSLADSGIDAFILLLDPGLFTMDVFSEVRAFTQERGIIFIVPDGAMVRSGATFSYAPGFRELGAYAGRLLTNVLKREATVADIGVIFPRTRYFAVNPVDVERFGLTVPPNVNPAALEMPRTIVSPEN
ncbi:MAG: carboxypeptidase regulatory-like domain-containing protein [Acidobacteria bacterium]|nr:carboxypeptidase regulatory-like domain-containing protein [Acidobacteriota bacterium]